MIKRIANKNQLFFALGLIVVSIFLSKCANPVMPIGGEKDTTPPRVVRSVPENYSVNFEGRLISIEFNEFVKLDKINQQALISPPLQKNPEYRIKGKSVQVRFQEDLKENTTYTVFFGNAIVDLTENNPLEAYSFVFSTGSILDSMSMAGNLQFAFNKKVAEGAFVLLYRDENDTIPADSLPFRVKPYYVARADKKGDFRFRNLRNEPYRMYALEDKNSNFLYDKGGEAIGFVDELVVPEYVGSYDTQKSDLAFVDTVGADGIKTEAEAYALSGKLADSIFVSKHKKHQISLFYEVDSTQRLLRAEAVRNGLLRFAFRYPAANVEIEPLEALPDTLGLLKHYSKKKDTVHWYFRDNVLDSMKIAVRFDTLINDTLNISLRPRAAVTPQRGRREEIKAGVLAYSTRIAGRRLDYGQKLIFTFNEPVIHYQMRDSSRFIAKDDTLYNSVEFLKYDSIGLQYVLNVPDFEFDGGYSLLAPDSIFFGLNGNVNDTIALAFKVPALTDYGNLFLKINPEITGQMIIQLLNPKEDVLEERIVNGSTELAFEHMKPGKYKFKAIHDRNGNGRWDTGDLVKGLQPEKVYYYSKELEIRPNWDLEEEWDLSADAEK
ncbi:MAG: Ig-like domain-containing protein [Bacteroidales bacterium]|nr:Ig-like domain-containing protein [Bacteroidales bacterium]